MRGERKKFLRASIHSLPPIKLQWHHEEPIWIGQWPIKKDKLSHLKFLVKKLLKAWHIQPYIGPYNTSIFIIEKKTKRKFRLLHDLMGINAFIKKNGHYTAQFTKGYQFTHRSLC